MPGVDIGNPPGVALTGGTPVGVAGFETGTAFSPLKTDPPPWLRLERIAMVSEVTMKTPASTAVVFDKKVVVPRGPKAV